MGMLDEKKYLTGRNGELLENDTFYLLNAKVSGTIQTPNGVKTEVKLQIRKEGQPDPVIVYTTGTAIVGQIERLDDADRSAMEAGGMFLRLSTLDTGKGNPAFIFTDGNQPAEPPIVAQPGGGPDVSEF